MFCCMIAARLLFVLVVVRAVWFRIHKTLIEMVSIKINALVL